MNRRPIRSWAPVLCALVTASSLCSQGSFAELYADASALPTQPAAARSAAFAEAFRAFSRLEIGSAIYRRDLVLGSRCALAAGSARRAADLAAEAWQQNGASDSLLDLRLRAMLRARRGAAAVTLARSQFGRRRDPVLKWFRDRDVFWALPRLAAALLLDGKEKEGVWVFATRTIAEPKSFEALCDLALTYRLLGQAERSRATYRRALGLTKHHSVFTDFGLLEKGQGRAVAAAELFRQGIAAEKKPGESAGAVSLAVLFQRGGKTSKKGPRADLVSRLRHTPSAAMGRRLLLDCLRHPRR